MKNEIWKPVVGHEGAYEVSNLGRVRSVPHYVRLVHACGTESKRLSPGRILKPGAKGDRHLTVAIGKGNSQQVHVLVMEAFVGPRPSKDVLGGTVDILHLNGDPTDNHLVNLRYGTRAENIRQDYASGVRRATRYQWERMYEGKMANRRRMQEEVC